MVSYVPEGMWSAERYPFLQATQVCLFIYENWGYGCLPYEQRGWKSVLLDMPSNVTTCSERTFAVCDQTMEKKHIKGMGLFILGKDVEAPEQ